MSRHQSTVKHSNKIHPSGGLHTYGSIHSPRLYIRPMSPSNSSSSLFSSIIQGFGFGSGSSLGNKAVNAITARDGVEHISVRTPSSKIKPEKQDINYSLDNIESNHQKNPYECKCGEHLQEYQECINSGQECDILYDRYIQCIERSFAEPSL